MSTQSMKSKLTIRQSKASVRALGLLLALSLFAGLSSSAYAGGIKIIIGGGYHSGHHDKHRSGHHGKHRSKHHGKHRSKYRGSHRSRGNHALKHLYRGHSGGHIRFPHRAPLTSHSRRHDRYRTHSNNCYRETITRESHGHRYTTSQIVCDH